MRQQQQGRRSRNRGGNRRNQNPLQRSYESNGPDVKIRGNAQVIADKYATLARDALSSGDSVMAENYLQHAEHYNRIILAAQPPQREEQRSEGEEQAGGEAAEGQPQAENQPQAKGRDDSQEQPQEETAAKDSETADAGEQPQPVIDGTPAEVRAEEAEQPTAEAKPRRPRKPRAPRKPKEEADNDAPVEAAADGSAEADETQGAQVAAE